MSQQYTVKSLEGKLILAATILASGMAFLDGTVVNIAIPIIQSRLHASIDGIQWVINSFSLLLAALILISGSLGDRFGRKKIFLCGIGLFIFASFLCSVAHTINQLIVFRAIQGVGAAMMIPGSLSIINSSFEEHIRGKVIGLWSGFAGGVAALGPFLGGWLVQTLGWPSIFYINIPLGIIAFLITLRFVPETKNNEARRLDLFGTFFILLSLLGISFGLIEAPILGWGSPQVVISLFAGALFFIAFIFTEAKIKMPLVPISIFKSPLVVGANIATLFLYFALSGVIFFLVLNLEQIQHYSPLIAGLSLLPSILIITFLSGPMGSISDKIGPRIPMIIGPLIVSLGMGSLILPTTQINYFISFFPGLVLFGIGMSIVIAPLTKSALSVDQKFSGAASGMNNAVSRTAALLAVALLGAIVLSFFSVRLTQSLTKSNSMTYDQQQQIIKQKNKLGGIEIPLSFTKQTRREAERAIENSFVYSFRIAMGVNASLALLSALVAFATIRNPVKIKKI